MVFPAEKPNKVLALLLPHVSTAKPKRIEYLQTIKSETNPTDIFVLSTNHFNSSQSKIVYDTSDWSESKNPAKGNTDFHPTTPDSVVSHDLVVNDHGIRNVMTELSDTFPDAKFVSYLIKNNTENDLLDGTLSDIGQYCQGETRNCLFVASVDLSHYSPSTIADLHDQFTLGALSTLDQTKIKKAETDSPEVLYMLTKWSKEHNLNSFNLFDHNNTGKINNDFETEVTSWMTGDYESLQQNALKSTTLMFAGDMMLDRLVNHEFANIGFEHIFDNFKDRVFWGTDASVANLEGPINDGPVKDDISINNLTFNFAPSSVKALSYINLDGFSLANNHTLNDSSSGLDRTRKILEDNGFFSFGSPNGIDNFSLKKIDSPEPVSLIGLNDLASFDETKLDELVKEQKAQGRFVVVFVHWGSEYQTKHNSIQEKLAHNLVDHGVDLIVGSHPHVVQDSEIYQGKLIVYSLGNFVFDQLFSSETQQGCLLDVEVLADKVRINFVPVISSNLKVQLSKGSQKQAVLDRIRPKGGYVNQEEDGTIILNR